MRKGLYKWGVSLALMQCVLLSACGEKEVADTSEGATEVSTEAPAEAPVEAAVEATVEEAAEEVSTEDSAAEALSETSSSRDGICKIAELDDGSTEKEFDYKELYADENQHYVQMVGTDGKRMYTFMDRVIDGNGNNDTAIAILDIESGEFKTVTYETQLAKLCVDENPDDGYEYEPGTEDLTIYGPMDEESGHVYLASYWDDDEFKGVTLDNFGVDKDGNIVAIAGYCHEYREDGQLKQEDFKYESLTFTPDGEYISSSDFYDAAQLEKELAQLSFVNDNAHADMSVEYSDGSGFRLDYIAWINDKQFVAANIDWGYGAVLMGIYTEKE